MREIEAFLFSLFAVSYRLQTLDDPILYRLMKTEARWRPRWLFQSIWMQVIELSPSLLRLHKEELALPSKKLKEELDGWLNAAGLPKSSDVCGVIAPHAGYWYSGRTAACGFGNIDPTYNSRVFLLGSSNHYYTPKCALSTATVYKTPIEDLPIDQEVIEELKFL
ncbi:unnamed protein product [Linum trigynum]|uniref:AmmeMemoRadiSam system protein B n=1 Tax=Linum trigynum TaxID=586398 RepID=A0AAV2D1G3_9ROSI